MPPTSRIDIDNISHAELVRYMFGKEFLVELPNAYAFTDEEMGAMMVAIDPDHELYESQAPLASQRASTSTGWAERSDVMMRKIPALASALDRGCRAIRFINQDDAILVFKIIERHLSLKSKELRNLLQAPNDELLVQLAKLEKLAKFLHPQVVYTLKRKEDKAKRTGQSTIVFTAPMQPTFGFSNKSRWSGAKAQEAPQNATESIPAVNRTPEYHSHIEPVIEQQDGDTFKNRTRRW